MEQGRLPLQAKVADYYPGFADMKVGIPQADGSLLIPQLLQPGDYLRWEVRIDSGETKVKAKKWEITNLPQIDPNTITYARVDEQGNVLAQLFQELTLAAAERLRFAACTNQNAKHLVFDDERRKHDRM